MSPPPSPNARWSSYLLAPVASLPARNAGFALVWPDHVVTLAQGGAAPALRLEADDVAVIDRALATVLTAEVPCTVQVQVLALDRAPLALRAERQGPLAAAAFDGNDPCARIIKQMWTIGREISGSVVADESIEARLADLIGDLGGKLMAQRVGVPVSPHTAAMVARAERLIMTHLDDPALSPATLAGRMRVSPRHLSSLFAATGTTTTAAILDRRMERARMLLADPGQRHRQIAGIARDCGFDDQSYFSRCFRRFVGVTPRVFRQDQHVPERVTAQAGDRDHPFPPR